MAVDAAQERDAALWMAVVAGHRAYVRAQSAFLNGASVRAATLGAGLRDLAQRDAALELAEYLSLEERHALLPEFLDCAMTARDAPLARPLVAGLPRSWVLSRLPALLEPYLARGDDEDYRRALELCSLLDPALTERLARRALAHDDPEVREVGADFLARPERC